MFGLFNSVPWPCIVALILFVVAVAGFFDPLSLILRNKSKAKLPRLFWLFVFTITVAVGLHYLAPQQTPVTIYKLFMPLAAGFIGYWIDRLIFPYARPHHIREAFSLGGPPLANRDLSFGFATIRRAIIIGSTILAVCLGA